MDVRLLLVLLLLIAGGHLRSYAQGRMQYPPNIIFILADDLGYGDLGAYGQRKIKTPHLDQMAREGTRFTQFYAGNPVCAPSRWASMTGLHMGHAYVRGNAGIPLRPQDRTVAEVLKAAGYATATYGKWGLGEQGTSGAPWIKKQLCGRRWSWSSEPLKREEKRRVHEIPIRCIAWGDPDAGTDS